jgi:DNA-binding transcriptional MerR regulator
MQSDDYVNISEVCQQTGVAAVTLRAWERRYGLIKPKRTPKGHRLYSQDDIAGIKQIVSWLERGVAISKVAALLTAAETPAQIGENEESWQQIQQELLSTLIELKQRSLNPLLDKLNKSMPFISLCEKVYQPLSRQLITRWQGKPLGHQLEKQLWQQCWQRQITVMTLRADKQKPKASCWLVNLDNHDIATDYWLFYGLLLQSGIQINAINQLDDLSALTRLKKSLEQPLIIFGDNKIATRGIDQLIKAKVLWHQNIIAIGPIADIHHDTFTKVAIEHTGGNASNCWQSAHYQAWVGQITSKQDNQ